MANELEKNIENTDNNTTSKDNDPETDLTALKAKIKQLESENGKLRQANTNASADASKWKKQYQEKEEALKAKMSDEERAKMEQEQNTAALQKELEDLRREKNVANYKGILMDKDIGMDAETAGNIAEAITGGNIDQIFDGIRKFVASHDKALREGLMANNPTLQGGNNSKKVPTKEEFKAMGYREMVEFKANYPDLFIEYTK